MEYLMSADLVQTVVIGSLGAVGTGFLGMTAWGVRRMITKQDKLDLLVRGDGNGNPGIGERIRDVHQEIKSVGTKLNEHVEESQGWQERIVAQEAKCEVRHRLEDEMRKSEAK
jgi:hypothetical protein